MANEPRPSSPQAESPIQAVQSSQHLPPVEQPDTMPQVAPVVPWLGWLSVWSAIGKWLRANTFVPHWLPARWRHPATGYLLVVLLQVGAVVVTRLLVGFFSTYAFPGALELLIVALMALSWGAGPSLFATLLGVVFEEIVVLPVFGDGEDTAADVVEVALFLAIGISISLVATASERSRRRAMKERTEAQERKLAAMRQVQEHMDAFLAIASHDLRTPVTTALGFIEIAALRCERLAAAARDEKPDMVRQIEGIRVCVRDACQSEERLSRLVNLLFDTSLARAGELELHRTSCDLAMLVRELVEGQRVSTPHRVIRLQVLTPEPIWVMADAARIGQVVTNYTKLVRQVVEWEHAETNQAHDEPGRG
jgi:signal transduction histidine kinase